MTKEQLAKLSISLGLPADADEATILAAAADLRQSNVAATAQLAEAAKTELAAGITAQITRAKKEGRIMPQQEAGLRKMVDGWIKDATNDAGQIELVEFATNVDGATVTKKGTIVEQFAAFVDELPVVFKNVTELGDGRQSEENLDAEVARDTIRFAQNGLGRQLGFDRASIERDRKVKAHAAKNNISYLAAYDAVVTGAM